LESGIIGQMAQSKERGASRSFLRPPKWNEGGSEGWQPATFLHFFLKKILFSDFFGPDTF